MKNQRILITFLGMLYFITVTSNSVVDIDSLVNSDSVDLESIAQSHMESIDHLDEAAVEKTKVNGANGISTIGDVLEAIRVGFNINYTVSNTSERIPYHTSLAAQYGTLTSESLKTIDRKLKVMIAGTNRLMKKLQMRDEYKDNEIPFEEYLGVMNQNVLIKEMEGSKYRNSDYLTFQETNWFKFDGSPEQDKIYQVEAWFANLINDMDVLTDTEINIIDFANIVAATGAAVKDFFSVFVAADNIERSIVDVGILRYPDIERPFFKLFRIKLRAYRKCFRLMATQRDESGIKGDYETVSFVPRGNVIKHVKEEAINMAVSEAESMFS
ncbi:uncharacterized protein LOC106877887 isoform X2 [Octopus bimaculoides]|uniref:uncharacterized protein LOC106877887 isoform X2 n=1 Tax=Octopus bimaculoides TaxID=37653 RepID=UPI00071DC333|nr:uncharacterized protein LOC106877887 isoform X2 [Octopus bimaculoides]|eukprot:XP_014782525.1 PREDICTED: uncharacterized protein LOC106877887 isoform X2 [Octopus bimaculoides]